MESPEYYFCGEYYFGGVLPFWRPAFENFAGNRLVFCQQFLNCLSALPSRWHKLASEGWYVSKPLSQRYSKSVLLVDDDPTDLVIFKRLLEKANFSVIATSDADAAMSLIVAGQVGCLVTDQAMPVTGHELTGHLRAVRSDVSVIFLSGADSPRQALPPGAIFVRKEDPQELVKCVTNCMLKHQTG